MALLRGNEVGDARYETIYIHSLGPFFFSYLTPPRHLACFPTFITKSLLLRPYVLIFKMQALTFLFLLFNAVHIESLVRHVLRAPPIPHLTVYRPFWHPLLVPILWYIQPPTLLGALYLPEVSTLYFPMRPQRSSMSHTYKIAKPKDTTTRVASKL